MARIYTRGGDGGTTALLSGRRVRKDDARLEAFGAVDELNCALGLARSFKLPRRLDVILAGVQNDLFHLGAARLSKEQVAGLERAIDELQAGLRPLAEFILPGGATAVASLHLARAICRRAERCCVRVKPDPLAVMYLNRLGDLLFVMARWAARQQGARERRWRK